MANDDPPLNWNRMRGSSNAKQSAHSFRVLWSYTVPGILLSGPRRMATVWLPDPLWSQQIGIGVCTRILPGAPAHLVLGRELLANKASRCSSVRRPALPLPRTCVGRDVFSNDAGRCQEQEHEVVASLD